MYHVQVQTSHDEGHHYVYLKFTDKNNKKKNKKGIKLKIEKCEM